MVYAVVSFINVPRLSGFESWQGHRGLFFVIIQSNPASFKKHPSFSGRVAPTIIYDLEGEGDEVVHFCGTPSAFWLNTFIDW